MLLTRNAPDIPLAVAVAYILNRLCSGHVLLAGLEINDESTVIIPRILIVHPLFDVDIHAADRIDDTLKCRRVNQDVMRYGNPHNFLHRGKRHLMSAERIGMVDLIIPVCSYLDACIARDGEQCCAALFLIDGSKHERITAPDIPIPAINSHDEYIAEIVLHDIGKCVRITK